MFSQASYGGQVTHTEFPREKLFAVVDNMSIQREDAFQASSVDSLWRDALKSPCRPL